MRFVGLEIGIQLPELTAHRGKLLPVCRVEGNERVDEPLGMNPTQAMTQDLELPGIVADYGLFIVEEKFLALSNFSISRGKLENSKM
jgi:hypothetical protein